MEKTEVELRKKLACILRLTARYDFHEGVANHFSVAVDDAGETFLINPAGQHFSTIRGRNLVRVTPDDLEKNNRVDETAKCLHGYFHRHLKEARCLLHTHMPYATALASLAEWKLLPIDQNACRFFNRVAYDEDFGGMLLAEEEAARQCRIIGNKSILIMRGHGVLIVARDIETAFDLMYYFERSCKNQWLALSTGKPLFIVPDEIAEKTAQQWEQYPDRHFVEMQRILSAEEPDYEY